MVLLFPSTADRSKRYSTSNGVYGEFYGTTPRESGYDRLGDCRRKLVEATEQLLEARSCSGGVGYTNATLDQGQRRCTELCCCGASFEGKMDCERKLRMPMHLMQDGFYKPPVPVEWNCKQCSQDDSSFAPPKMEYRQQHEPEFFEDHVRHYHPRLAPKLQVLPRVIFGQSNRQMSRGGYSRAGNSVGGSGVRVNVELASSGSNSRSRKRPGSASSAAKPGVLPTTSRYNFYRYYGSAGQGAKTTKGYRPKI